MAENKSQVLIYNIESVLDLPFLTKKNRKDTKLIYIRNSWVSDRKWSNCWHNGSVFVFCPGDNPFKSEPIPTSTDACGEVTGCAAGHQEVSMCSTRGGSQGTYNISISAKKSNKAEPKSGFETQRRHYQKSKTGARLAQNWYMCMCTIIF